MAVAVFAYNEAERIGACLDALARCATEAALQVFVLINGCTDNTEQVVRDHPGAGVQIHPVVIARGDKANAWNLYVHEVAPAGMACHVFTDGDMLVQPGSIAGFLETFAAHPEVTACAGLPVSGRSVQGFRAQLAERRELAGNLYALRPELIEGFRDRKIRLPFGIFGEDGLVTALVKYDLDTLGTRRDERVMASQKGGFAFEPLSPWRLADLRTYRNRKRRYAMRHQQALMLYDLLYREGVAAMPAHVLDLYRQKFKLTRLTWRGLDTIFDWEARRRIARDLAMAEQEVREADRAHLYS